MSGRAAVGKSGQVVIRTTSSRHVWMSSRRQVWTGSGRPRETRTSPKTVCQTTIYGGSGFGNITENRMPNDNLRGADLATSPKTVCQTTIYGERILPHHRKPYAKRQSTGSGIRQHHRKPYAKRQSTGRVVIVVSAIIEVVVVVVVIIEGEV
jgi:hypothetical protein